MKPLTRRDRAPGLTAMLPHTPLIIAGMHRSGTSLAAALLRDAGLAIGERLLDLGGTARGHSEDLDVLGLHQAVLADNGLSAAGWTLESDIHWSTARAREARALVERRAAQGVSWGWKDPRTTLMLPFWLRLLPRARCLLLFRSPWAVADSLYRRGDFEFFWRPTLAVKIWLHYNTLLLDMVEREPGRCLLASADRTVAAPAGLIAAVNARWSYDFRPPAQDIVENGLFTPDSPDPERIWAIERLFPAALTVWERLHRAAGLPAPAASSVSLPDSTSQEADPLAVFERWVADCRASRARTAVGEATVTRRAGG